jgi:hypothetical protein
MRRCYTGVLSSETEMLEPARNLRTAERFLLAPPLAATFGSSPVAICDISAKGARFKHDRPIEMGTKGMLKMPLEVHQPDAAMPGRFVSGARTYASAEVVTSLIAHLQTSHRSNRIEELRSTDRFFIEPALEAKFGDTPVQVENLSARGARIESASDVRHRIDVLRLALPSAGLDLAVTGTVVWTAVKAIAGAATKSYRAGLFINEKSEMLRLAIGQLCEMNRASLDTQSLRLKLKILRARARQLAPSFRAIEQSGIPAEQFLLIQGVREELRMNPEEAMHWYRRARLVINDPATRAAAPPIADHPDALAVWEYLDRTVDPTIVGRAFEIPLVG